MAGQPTKFKEEFKPIIEMLYRKGATDKEVAKALCVHPDTIQNWKKYYASFFESLNDWKLAADDKVVRSLLERATGYSCPEEKVFYDKDLGKTVTHESIKHFPPDPTSMIFWLKNRRPKEWRDKVDHHNTQDKPTEVKVTFNSEAPKRVESDFSADEEA